MNKFGGVERNHSEYGKGSGENLKVFEKTWGHRLLMGLCVCMFVGGLTLAIYCGMRYNNLSITSQDDAMLLIAYVLYRVGFVAGALVIPPAILGVFVATHPRFVVASIIAGVVGLLCVGAFIVYAASTGGQPFSIALYGVASALAPLLYLASSLKIKFTKPASYEC